MADQQTESAGQSSGASWWKWLLGCGCLGLMILICAGTAGVVYFGYVARSVAEDVTEGVEVRAEVVEQRDKVLRSGDVAVDLETPLSAVDYEALKNTVADWKAADSFQQLKHLSEQETSDDSKSFVESLRVLYQVWQAATSFQKLGEHYIEVIEENGGIEKHYHRFLRIGAVVAAAHEVASDRRFDNPGEPTSDAVAELLYERRGEVLKAYGSEISELRSGSHTFESLANQGDLGVFALATLPIESYQPWADYSVEERKALIETFAWTVAAESLTFGGFAFPVSFDKGLPKFSR